MPIAITRAFVLETAPFNEQDKLVYLLSANRGILKAIAPGALKNKNRFGSLLELFTESDFQYYWKEEKEMITISRGDLVTTNFNVVSEPSNIFYFYLIAEILMKFVPYTHRDNRIFRLVRAILESRTGGAIMNLLLLYFLVWIIRIEGMMFDPGICTNCSEKNLRRAWMRADFRGLLCEKCRTNENLMFEYEDLKFVRWTEKHSPREVDAWKDSIDVAKLVRTFKRKIEHHGELILKTTQYLSEFR